MRRKSGLDRWARQRSEKGGVLTEPPTGDGSVVIRTVGLTKRYGARTAVDDLSLAIRRGEIFGLLGPNGAGKTTTVLMLLGLTEPSAGKVLVLGFDPTRDPLQVKRRVGYLPDSVGFYGSLSGRENLRYTAQLNGIGRRAAETRIAEVLEQVGLTSRADDHTERYSRGMRQRLGIADALVKDPEILILDEPTTAIDPIGVVEILDLIRGLARERGLAILLASHLLDQIQIICNRVAIFHEGRVIGEGSIDDLAIEFGQPTDRLEIGVNADTGNGASADQRGVPTLLAGVPGVAAVDPGEEISGRPTWHITPAPGFDEATLGRAVIDAVLGAGMRLERFGRSRPSLEQIYRRAVERIAEGVS